MYFKRINLNKHKETAVSFREDSFFVSFGTADHFNKDEYLRWLSSQIKCFPDGFMPLFHNGQPIGQLEASIKFYRSQKIGYVHLYYMTEQQRGRGCGTKLHQYVRQFFRANGVSEYHLRVSPGNEEALSFYRKKNMEVIGSECNGKVLRMRGAVPPE
ncbi:GNAT family N-acetyltransferase [Bacillus sp. JHAA]|uniref:GNAT family N-acetyltransferase n=1 Tax=Bacillus TaxID=1386 RepID=UPI00042EB00E|nr:GNAT family N-acetyltransferase [Bacillus velezensis]AHK49926.1 GCN5 family acetyltransferase [Bacillus velezensis TrigoCor1448]MDR0142127.1 GNAT family N-acetyltransferase [Bacillus velezensis]MEC1564535.1 GNAT family N-acetyltransferase [Bacillus velezensis]MEC2147297.1 GNAT family N-acetyltransferase [Bacillus velezensis]